MIATARRNQARLAFERTSHVSDRSIFEIR
jgi:hypothetical protein